MSRRGRIASDKLTRRLVDLARQGKRPRCGDGETSHSLVGPRLQRHKWSEEGRMSWLDPLTNRPDARMAKDSGER
jgi:hypothetical protein